MLAQMIWSTIVYLFLTSLGAPRTNKNNNVVNLYHNCLLVLDVFGCASY